VKHLSAGPALCAQGAINSLDTRIFEQIPTSDEPQDSRAGGHEMRHYLRSVDGGPISFDLPHQKAMPKTFGPVDIAVNTRR
jgi:hypothetical protein